MPFGERICARTVHGAGSLPPGLWAERVSGAQVRLDSNGSTRASAPGKGSLYVHLSVCLQRGPTKEIHPKCWDLRPLEVPIALRGTRLEGLISTCT